MCCLPAAAQLPALQTKAVDTLISSYVSAHHVPGLSIAVVQHSRVVLAQGYGIADVENNVHANADTVYRIASISKSITASAVMKLVESGKIDLDVPIQKYCPAFPPKPWPITTRELLSHQSGIRDYRNDEETVNTRHYTSIDEALRQFDKDPLEFEPGTKMQYTSYGYIVLGCVIEGASGTAYDRYMREAVFGPAQMPATRLDDVSAVIPHRAHGYSISSNGGNSECRVCRYQ
jgi:serine beta-lactamase-like protein LACTB, mitochondrial